MKRYLFYILLQILCICLLPTKGQSTNADVVECKNPNASSYTSSFTYPAFSPIDIQAPAVSGIEQVNSGYSYSNAVFDECVLYPNPYIVFTPKGYTKHYYAGVERIATVLGGGGFILSFYLQRNCFVSSTDLLNAVG